MLKSIALLALLSPLASHAEVFTCLFTEPFITIVYSTDTKVATVTNHSVKKTSIAKEISFQIVGPAEYVLKNAKGKEVASLKLTNQGSDGMSDTIFPFEIETSLISANAPNNGFGGCTSTLLSEKQGQN